jgi:hypothetical protein
MRSVQGGGEGHIENITAREAPHQELLTTEGATVAGTTEKGGTVHA